MREYISFWGRDELLLVLGKQTLTPVVEVSRVSQVGVDRQAGRGRFLLFAEQRNAGFSADDRVVGDPAGLLNGLQALVIRVRHKI